MEHNFNDMPTLTNKRTAFASKNMPLQHMQKNANPIYNYYADGQKYIDDAPNNFDFIDKDNLPMSTSNQMNSQSLDAQAFDDFGLLYPMKGFGGNNNNLNNMNNQMLFPHQNNGNTNIPRFPMFNTMNSNNRINNNLQRNNHFNKPMMNDVGNPFLNGMNNPHNNNNNTNFNSQFNNSPPNQMFNNVPQQMPNLNFQHFLPNNNTLMGIPNTFSNTNQTQSSFGNNSHFPFNSQNQFPNINGGMSKMNGMSLNQTQNQKGGFRREDYIFEKFGKRGWQCEHCNNFNFESKFYLLYIIP
jgi:hypothetical protein